MATHKRTTFYSLIFSIISLVVFIHFSNSLFAQKKDIKSWNAGVLSLQERVYLHTNKQYYYAGERIWAKAYLQYLQNSFQDSLSKVLYVELINPSKKIIQTAKWKIQEGGAAGEFDLPDTLSAGNYFIRAYTNFMRNFGDTTFLYRQIPVLKINQIPIGKPITEISNGFVEISTNKENFSTREKVQLTIKSLKLRHFSLSISDTTTVKSIDRFSLKPTFIEKIPEQEITINHPVEKGIYIKGQVFDKKNTATQGNLIIASKDPELFVTTETDENGKFGITFPDAKDTLLFTIQSLDTKGKALPKLIIEPYNVPLVSYLPTIKNYSIRNVFTQMNEDFKLNDKAIALEEVVVKRKQTDEAEFVDRISKIYGKADFVLKGTDIQHLSLSNPLEALQGRVPGVKVVRTLRDGIEQIIVSVRAGQTSSFYNNIPPLILVDGIPYDNANAISGISTSMIDRIDVIKRPVTIYGSRGAGGVIAIYTKSRGDYKVGEEQERDVEKKGLHKIAELGYAKYHTFEGPNYEIQNNKNKEDYRNTLYWHPNLQIGETGETTIEFFTADRPTSYRIQLEGVLDNGKLIRVEKLLKVE